MTKLYRVRDLTYDDLKKRYKIELTLSWKIIFYIFLWGFIYYAFGKDPLYWKFVLYIVWLSFFLHIFFGGEIYKKIENFYYKLFSWQIKKVNKELENINSKAMEKAEKEL